jgi:membrane-associated phospholipid phosphatase
VNASPPQRRWALRSGWSHTWQPFHQAWKALPAGAFKRWWTTLLIGFVLCAAFVSVLTVVARRNANALTRWDTDVLLRVERGPISFADAILLESFGNLAYMVPLTLAAAVVAARSGRPLLALSFPVAYVLQRPLVLLGWWIWNRQRPRLIADGIAAPGLHSFPSGHVALMLAVYGLLAWLWVRASRSVVERLLVLVLLAALLLVTGAARVRLGSHWPSDVLAGYAVGAAWLGVVITAVRRAERSVP